jgi:hypothetical protein
MRVTRRERFVIWMFGNKREAHRTRDSLYAYLVIVAFGALCANAHDFQHLAWWRQLGVIGIFALLPYIVLRVLLRDAEQERHREDLDKLVGEHRDDE